MDKTEKITIRLPKEMKEWLAQKAEEKDLTMSQIVRKAVSLYMKED